jgi:hypothetical protein
MLSSLMLRTRTVKFLCAAEDRGVIAEPVQAKTVLPD